MSTIWSDILEEYQKEQAIKHRRAAWARVLFRKVELLTQKTHRPLLIYATACTASGRTLPGNQTAIGPDDKIGFHDMIDKLQPPKLDVLIHSPGGLVESAETIIEEIRRKFDDVRFIVPSYAKSAATIMAMAADEILIDEDAELGPIDPQMPTANGYVAAEAIKEQFDKASKEILEDPAKLSIWIPILQPMGPALLVQCDNALNLSKRLVTEWLTRYMFRGQADAATRAAAVAAYLGTHANFSSHGRRVKFEHLNNQAFDLKITNLRSDAELYRKVWGVYCALDVMFANTGVYKVFYNSDGDAMIRMNQEIAVPMPMQAIS